MDDPYDDEQLNTSETFEDIYKLKAEVDDSDVRALREKLQQIRYEIAATDAKIKQMRTASVDPFTQTSKVDNTQAIKTEMEAARNLKREQKSIIDSINSSIINQVGTVDRMVNALGRLNAEMKSGNMSAQNLSAFVSIVEGASARMGSVSKKSEDYSKLQTALSESGITLNIDSIKHGSKDINVLQTSIEKINDTPVILTIDGTHTIQTTISQMDIVIQKAKELAALQNRNVQLQKTIEGTQTTSIITPSSYSGPLTTSGKPLSRVGSIYDIVKSQQIPSQQSSDIPPNEVVRAAFFGAAPFWREQNRQVRGPKGVMAPQGTSSHDTKARMAQLGLTVEAPALSGFGGTETSTFLNVDTGLINKHFEEFLKPIDPTILTGMKTLESKFNRNKRITKKNEMGAIVNAIISDQLLSQADKATYIQLAKVMALEQQDFEQSGKSGFYRRGKPGVDLSGEQEAILALIDQWGGSLQTSEMSKSLGTGHYQGVAKNIRALLNKGMIRRAIEPVFPIPELGIENQVAPQIMAMMLTDPKLALEAMMGTSSIKLHDTSDLGKRVLAMTGARNDPGYVHSKMSLNTIADIPANVRKEDQALRFAVEKPEEPRLWFKGINNALYGETAMGDKIIYNLGIIANNTEAFNPDFAGPLAKFIPTTDDGSGLKSVDIQALREDPSYQLSDVSTAHLLNANSDIQLMMRTPHMFIDQIMQMIAPNRDLYARDSKGEEFYRKAVLNWASGSEGMGVNPQLGRYTATSDQATQYLQILWGALEGDASDKKKDGDYVGYTHYERSILLRAAQLMIERAIPITSGFDVATNEALRSRAGSSKAEDRKMVQMLLEGKNNEVMYLFQQIRDMGKLTRTFEKYNNEVLNKVANPMPGWDGLTGPNENAYPLMPDQLRRIHGNTTAATAWKNHPEFFNPKPGETYEETYQLGGPTTPGEITSHKNQIGIALSNLGVPTHAKQLNVPSLTSNLTKFRKEDAMATYVGNAGRLPWNPILEHYAQMGSQDLTPEAQVEFERLMANPQELMKELHWDMDEELKDVYGTVLKKRPQFSRAVSIPQAALDDLDKRTEFHDPGAIHSKIEHYTAKMHQFSGTWYGKEMQYRLKDAKEELVAYQEGYDAEMEDWREQWGLNDAIDSVDIINPFKENARGQVGHFWKYSPESVPKDKVIARMDYERQQGLMDPELLEKYARSVASQKTNKDSSMSAKRIIEAMWRNSGNQYGLMDDKLNPHLPTMVENKLLQAFMRFGSGGTFDFSKHADESTTPNWDTTDFSPASFLDASGNDVAMMDEETIQKYFENDPGFKDTVKESLMKNQELSPQQYAIIIEDLVQETRQEAKRSGKTFSMDINIEEMVREILSRDVAQVGSDGRYPLGSYEPRQTPESMSNLTSRVQLMDVVKKLYWEHINRRSKSRRVKTPKQIENSQYALMAGSYEKRKNAGTDADYDVLDSMYGGLSGEFTGEWIGNSPDGRLQQWLAIQNHEKYLAEWYNVYEGFSGRNIHKELGIQDLVVGEFKDPKALARRPDDVARYSGAIKQNTHPEFYGSMIFRGLHGDRAKDILNKGIGDLIPRVGTIQNWTHSNSVARIYAKPDDESTINGMLGVILQSVIPEMANFIMGEGKEDKNFQFAHDQDWRIANRIDNVPIYGSKYSVMSVIPHNSTPGDYGKDPRYKNLRMIDDMLISNLDQPFGDWEDDPQSHMMKVSSMMPIVPKSMPRATIDTTLYNKKTNEPLPGAYNFLGNTLKLNPDAKYADMDKVIRHELTHAAGYDVLLGGDTLMKLQGAYKDNHIDFFEHSETSAAALAEVHKSTPIASIIQKYLSKLPADVKSMEEDRLKPFLDYFTRATEKDVADLYKVSEDIAITMAEFRDDFDDHVDKLYKGKATFTDKVKTSLIRNVMGIETPMPTMPGVYPSDSTEMFDISVGAMLPTMPTMMPETGDGGYIPIGRSSYVPPQLLLTDGTNPLVTKLLRDFHDNYIAERTPLLLTEGSGSPYAPGPFIPSGSITPVYSNNTNSAFMGTMGPGVQANAGPSGVIAMGGENAGIIYGRTSPSKYYNTPNEMYNNKRGVLGYEGSIGDRVAIDMMARARETGMLLRMGLLTEGGGVGEPGFNVNPTPLDIPDLVGKVVPQSAPYVKSARQKIEESLVGKLAMGTKGFVSKVMQKHGENFANKLASLPDVSLGDPNKVVVERGTEIPISYILSSKHLGEEGMMKEANEFPERLRFLGMDTSKLRRNIIYEQGKPTKNADGTETIGPSYAETIWSGKLRIPQSIMGNRDEHQVAFDLRTNEMTLGYAATNEQAERYEKTLPRLSGLMQQFGEKSHWVGDLSWKFTTLQMAALGIFFSMMSIVSVMGQGIGLVLGGLGDMESMMKAKAMAGMSGSFTNANGEVWTGQAIDDKMGIGDADRITAWKNYTDMVSTISTILSAFGTKLMNAPRFLSAANTFINKLIDTLSTDESLERAVSLGELLFETLGKVVDTLPAVIDLFKSVASLKAPDWMPVVGGSSVLAAFSVASLGALIVMPILAGVTLLLKAVGFIGWVATSIDGIFKWNLGRKIGNAAIKDGIDPVVRKAMEQGLGNFKGSPADIAHAERTGMSAGLEASVADDIEKANKGFAAAQGIDLPDTGLKSSGEKIVSTFDNIAERAGGIFARIPKWGKVAVGGATVVGAAAASTIDPNSEVDIKDVTKPHASTIDPDSINIIQGNKKLIDIVGKDWEYGIDLDGNRRVMDQWGRVGHPDTGFVLEDIFGENVINHAGVVNKDEVRPLLEKLYDQLELNDGYINSKILQDFDTEFSKVNPRIYEASGLDFRDLVASKDKLYDIAKQTGVDISNVKPPTYETGPKIGFSDDGLHGKNYKTSTGGLNIVDDGTSKWKWVKGTLGANAIGFIPSVIETAFPQTSPVMGPANTALAFSPAIGAATGVGSIAAGAMAAPIAVIASAPAVGGAENAFIDGRLMNRYKVPKQGLIEGLLGQTEYKYMWDSGEEAKGFTDYDWSVAKKQANNMSNDPLSSKWRQEGVGSFSQTNNITVENHYDTLKTIEEMLTAIKRQVGA